MTLEEIENPSKNLWIILCRIRKRLEKHMPVPSQANVTSPEMRRTEELAACVRDLCDAIGGVVEDLDRRIVELNAYVEALSRKEQKH